MSVRSQRRYYAFGAFRMDPLRRRLYGPDGEAITLKPKVFDTLLYLVEHSGELLDKRTLMEGIWGDAVVEENSLNQHISVLRRALGEAPGDNRFIVTVQGHGYRFVATVHEAAGEGEVAGERAPAPSPGGHVGHAANQRSGTAHSHGPVRVAMALVVLALGIGAAHYGFSGRFDPAPSGARPLVAARPAPNSVAVLPFDNAGDRGDLQLSITEGLGDSLREHLRRLPGSPLQVTWRTSSKMFDADDDLAAIAARLPVAYLVHGTLSAIGDDLHARVEIYAAQNDSRWSADYDFGAADLLSVEASIARDVTAQLLPENAPATVSRTPEADERVAHQLLLLGRLYESQVRDALVLDDEKLAQAIDAYHRATQVDPNSGEAYSRLAAALLYRGDIREAKAPLDKALDLAADRSETQYTLALYRLRLGLDGIAEAYEHAIAYDPDNADALGAYGQWVWGHRDAADAQQYLEHALDLDRQSPTRWSDYVEYLGNTNRRDALLDLVEEIQVRFPNAEGHRLLARLYELTGDLDPESPVDVNVWYFYAFAYLVTGEPRNAIYALESTDLPQRMLTQAYTAAEEQALMTYIHALRATGDEAGVRRYAMPWAESLQRQIDTGMGDAWWSNAYLACVQAELGNVGAALEALDRIRTGSVGLPWSSLLVDSPCFGHLADQPSYQALLAHVQDRRARLRAKLPATLERHGLSSLKTSATP